METTKEFRNAMNWDESQIKNFRKQNGIKIDKSRSQYKIEKGVYFDPQRYSRWAELIQRMVMGDSVFVKTLREARALAGAGFRRNKRFRYRPENKGFRVWYIKDKKDLTK